MRLFNPHERAALAGREIRPLAPTTIRIGELRSLLTGRAPAITIDGGPNFNVTIVDDEPTPGTTGSDSRDLPGSALGRLLSLEGLTRSDGRALPALSLRRCRIAGVLNISRSHLTSIELYHCMLRGIIADRVQVDNDCAFVGIVPYSDAEKYESWMSQGRTGDDFSALRTRTDAFCQIRMVSAQITGAVTVSNSLLRSPTIDQWETAAGPKYARDGRLDRLDPPNRLGAYANHFALSLAGSEIGGRLSIGQRVEAWGGVSLHQTRVRSSLRLAARIIAVHDPDEPVDRKTAFREVHTAVAEPVAVPPKIIPNFLALSATELKVGGAITIGSSAANGRSQSTYFSGRLCLVRARIDSDLLFEQAVFIKPDVPPAGGGTLETVDPNGGGIDLRRGVIGGQLTIRSGCRIGRRRRGMSGLPGELGPALDAWKAEIALGVEVEARARFHGPVLFNGAKIGRGVNCGGAIVFAIDPPPKRPFYTAFSIADSVIDGHVRVALRAVSGRVSFERARVQGAFEIEKIRFMSLLVKRGTPGVFPSAPSTRTDEPLGFQFKDPPNDDQMSILDLQDTVVSGGTNIKRSAISLWVKHEVDAVPFHHLIVDMRGMSSASWDDADGTCWHGLCGPPPRKIEAWGMIKGFVETWRTDLYEEKRIPWRLRFSGTQFGRLDSSQQKLPIPRRITTGWRYKGHPQRPWLEWLRRNSLDADAPPAENEAQGWRRLAYVVRKACKTRIDGLFGSGWIAKRYDSRDERKRLRITTQDVEELHYRLTALESFRANRWRWEGHRGFLPWLERWIRQSDWRRKEIIPSFDPQPFDLFAKAYAAGGNLEMAAEITRKRITLQWKHRIRSLLRWCSGNYRIVWLIAVALATISCFWRDQPFDFLQLFVLLLLVVISPGLPALILYLSIFIFHLTVGYGLSGRRAVLTFIVVSLLIPISAPFALWTAVGAKCMMKVQLPIIGTYAYGIDKIIPIDGKVLERPLDAVKARITSEKSTVEEQACATKVYDRAKVLDMIMDIIGWITISFALLTLTGILRREVERGT